jgi:sterol desaturase/sphingolipid hydroxylase (fatty acid hydroxylase superfamily)
MIVCAIVMIVGALMMGLERARPGRQWRRVRGWWLRAGIVNCVQVSLVLSVGWLWNEWMGEHRLFSIDAWGAVVGGVFGYLCLTFVYYWWHRWRHEVGWLWRLHQMHHSAQRIEVLTSFYKHPLEIFSDCLLTSTILFMLLGLGARAAMVAVLLSGLGELFYHWNYKTPRWLGYFFQRPESHCVHHEEGVHHFNYSDLPLWDILFGTFKNPDAWEGRCGLGAENENRVLELLLCLDVSSRGEVRAVTETMTQAR